MISAETLRKHPAFSHLSNSQLQCLADVSKVITVEPGEFLFHKGDEIHNFFLVIEGLFEVVFETPKLVIEYEQYGQPSRMEKIHTVIGTIPPGDFLGWSGLVHPFNATSGIRSKGSGRLISFDCKKLLDCFEKDCEFGFYMIQNAAQVIGKRLNDIYKGIEK